MIGGCLEESDLVPGAIIGYKLHSPHQEDEGVLLILDKYRPDLPDDDEWFGDYYLVLNEAGETRGWDLRFYIGDARFWRIA